MRIIYGIIVTVCMMTAVGCAMYQAPVIPPGGFLFSTTKAPMDVNTDKTDLGTKTGEPSAIAILSLFSFGDCSINSAARNGNLRTVNHVDYSYLNVLGVFQSFTTIAYGD